MLGCYSQLRVRLILQNKYFQYLVLDKLEQLPDLNTLKTLLFSSSATENKEQMLKREALWQLDDTLSVVKS